MPFGIDESELAPVFLDFAADPHFLVLGDTECGKSNLLRLAVAGLAARYTPEQAKIIFLDYRRSLLDAAQVPHQIGYATSSVAATALLDEVRGVLSSRLPPADLSPAQLRSRSWWRGSDLFVVVDDYDLVAGAAGAAGWLGRPGRPIRCWRWPSSCRRRATWGCTSSWPGRPAERGGPCSTR